MTSTMIVTIKGGFRTIKPWYLKLFVFFDPSGETFKGRIHRMPGACLLIFAALAATRS